MVIQTTTGHSALSIGDMWIYNDIYVYMDLWMYGVWRYICKEEREREGDREREREKEKEREGEKGTERERERRRKYRIIEGFGSKHVNQDQESCRVGRDRDKMFTGRLESHSPAWSFPNSFPLVVT